MRTLFSTFPRGWPGLGLLLLRVVVGVTVVVHGVRAINRAIPSMAAWGTPALAIGSGIAVTAGCFTSITAVLLIMGTIGVAFGWIPWSATDPLDPGVSTIFVVSMCAAIALLGPGALSVDARLGGRREIVIPRSTNIKRRSS